MISSRQWVSFVFILLLVASTASAEGERKKQATFEYLASLADGEVVASHGDIPSGLELDAQDRQKGCPPGRACGRSFTGGMPGRIGPWLAIVDLHLQVGGDKESDGDRNHQIESMTKDVAERLERSSSSSATEALREIVQFQPSSNIGCAAKLEVFSLRDLMSYEFIDREQMQRVGASQRPDKQLASRHSLGIGPETTGELLFRHRQIGQYFELQLYLGTEYDARKWGEGMAVERVLRCRSKSPISLDSLSRYHLFTHSAPSQERRVVVTERQ